MNELPSNIESEQNLEPIPIAEEILSVFEQLAGEVKFEEMRKLEDKEGLYLWEVKIPNEDGGYTEYAYMRKGKYPEGQASDTVIYVTFYDEKDIPISGHKVAKYINKEFFLES